VSAILQEPASDNGEGGGDNYWDGRWLCRESVEFAGVVAAGEGANGADTEEKA
jgi:hypothetical protein